MKSLALSLYEITKLDSGLSQLRSKHNDAVLANETGVISV